MTAPKLIALAVLALCAGLCAAKTCDHCRPVGGNDRFCQGDCGVLSQRSDAWCSDIEGICCCEDSSSCDCCCDLQVDQVVAIIFIAFVAVVLGVCLCVLCCCYDQIRRSRIEDEEDLKLAAL